MATPSKVNNYDNSLKYVLSYYWKSFHFISIHKLLIDVRFFLSCSCFLHISLLLFINFHCCFFSIFINFCIRIVCIKCSVYVYCFLYLISTWLFVFPYGFLRMLIISKWNRIIKFSALLCSCWVIWFGKNLFCILFLPWCFGNHTPSIHSMK